MPRRVTMKRNRTRSKEGLSGVRIEVEKAMALLRRIDGYCLSEDDARQQEEAVSFLRETVVRYLKRNQLMEKSK